MPAPQRNLVETAPLSISVRALARRGELCRFAKGTVLIQEGLPGDTIYIVLEGRLRAYGSSITSDREITYGVYGPGEYVGEMGLDGEPRSASVIAVEPTICAMVTRRTLELHLREDPDFAKELLVNVIRRARAATASLKDMALRDVYGRLKQLLETLARPDGNGRLVAERLTHRELANRLGCSREMVTRLLRDLQEGAYLEVKRGEIELLKTLPPGY